MIFYHLLVGMIIALYINRSIRKEVKGFNTCGYVFRTMSRVFYVGIE